MTEQGRPFNGTLWTGGRYRRKQTPDDAPHRVLAPRSGVGASPLGLGTRMNRHSGEAFRALFGPGRQHL